MPKNYLLMLLFSFLTSCSVFSPIQSKPITSYVINSVPNVKKSSYKRPIKVFVQKVEADALYDSNQMIYVLKPYQVAYFAYNRWVEPPAHMLRPLIVQTLKNSRHFKVVSSSQFFLNYDYVLNTQLVKLEQNFVGKRSYIKLVLYAQIYNAKNNRIIADKSFSKVVVAPYWSPYGGVIAANKATASMLKDLVTFCMKVL